MSSQPDVRLVGGPHDGLVLGRPLANDETVTVTIQARYSSDGDVQVPVSRTVYVLDRRLIRNGCITARQAPDERVLLLPDAPTFTVRDRTDLDRVPDRAVLVPNPNTSPPGHVGRLMLANDEDDRSDDEIRWTLQDYPDQRAATERPWGQVPEAWFPMTAIVLPTPVVSE